MTIGMNEGSATEPSRAATWPRGSGEMAELIRAHDWEALVELADVRSDYLPHVGPTDRATSSV